MVENRYVLVSLTSQEIHLWDLQTYSIVRSFAGLNHSKYIVRTCLGGHENLFVYSGSEDGSVIIWHRETGKLIERLKGHEENTTVSCVVWNKKKNMIASTGDDHRVLLWTE